MRFVNLTPHVVRLNDGREFPPSGTVCRVNTRYTGFAPNGICFAEWGAVENLPDEERDTIFIVSGLVAQALLSARRDVVSPATGHPEARRENGQIVSVPGFVRW